MLASGQCFKTQLTKEWINNYKESNLNPTQSRWQGQQATQSKQTMHFCTFAEKGNWWMIISMCTSWNWTEEHVTQNRHFALLQKRGTDGRFFWCETPGIRMKNMKFLVILFYINFKLSYTLPAMSYNDQEGFDLLKR